MIHFSNSASALRLQAASLAGLFAGFVLVCAAGAANLDFNVANGNFLTPGNWIDSTAVTGMNPIPVATSAVPTIADNAFIRNGGTATINSDVSVLQIRVGHENVVTNPDYDNDGTVNAGDYVLWRKRWSISKRWYGWSHSRRLQLLALSIRGNSSLAGDWPAWHPPLDGRPNHGTNDPVLSPTRTLAGRTFASDELERRIPSPRKSPARSFRMEPRQNSCCRTSKASSRLTMVLLSRTTRPAATHCKMVRSAPRSVAPAYQSNGFQRQQRHSCQKWHVHDERRANHRLHANRISRYQFSITTVFDCLDRHRRRRGQRECRHC